MAIHKETRSLDYSPQQLFELIAEVERYPEFLPLWQEVQVSKTTPQNTDSSVYYTDQVIKLGPFNKQFQTKTILTPFHSIHIDSSDSLFQKFSIDWSFTKDKNDSCRIEFALDCVAASPFLRPVFDLALMESARSIVSTFENRARSLYNR
jgi:coenzyme Q-binding protein COQ10